MRWQAASDGTGERNVSARSVAVRLSGLRGFVRRPLITFAVDPSSSLVATLPSSEKIAIIRSQLHQ